MPWDTKVDVWSLGCVVAEVQVGQPIFRRSSVEGVLAATIGVLGPIPDFMVEYCPKLSNMFFRGDGKAYQMDPSGVATGAYMLQPLPRKQLPLLLAESASPDLFGGGLEGFCDLAAKLLTIDPSKRPTAAEVIQDPWLVENAPPLPISGCTADSGTNSADSSFSTTAGSSHSSSTSVSAPASTAARRPPASGSSPIVSSGSGGNGSEHDGHDATGGSRKYEGRK